MDLSFMEWFLPMYVTVAQLTLAIAVIGIAISAVIGIVASPALYYRILGLKQLAAAYVELSCSIPLLVQLLLLYLGPPKVGIRLSPELYGIIGLSFLGGAYVTGISRAGLETAERIQSEPVPPLDMSQAATMRYVVLSQAMAVSVPSLVANIIFLIKETLVFNGIVLADLMHVTKDLIGIYYQTTEAFFMLVIAYLALLLLISLFGSWAERRFRYAGPGN